MWSLQAVKLSCLLGLALVPLLLGVLPAALLRLRGALGDGASRSWRSVLNCAAGGVFLAACLLDVVPDSLEDLREELRLQNLSLDFPLPELVLALGFLLVLVVEQVVLDCSERRGDESALPLLPDGEAAAGPGAPHSHSHSQAGHQDRSPSPFRSLVLLLGLSLHSVFEGLAVGLRDTQAAVLKLTVAILLHKSAVAFSLALLLFQSPRSLGRRAASVAFFVLMTPLGLGLGMAVTEGAGTGGGTARSLLGGLAAGTFTYITFLEILPQELDVSGSRLPKVLAVLLGFSGMAALRFLG